MTDEERKLVLHYLKYEAEPPRLYSNSEADCEYWKMRVNALQKLIDELERPCEDAISRQAVDTLVDELARAISDERCCILRGRSTATIMQDICHLSPVTPAEKVGHWEWVQYDGNPNIGNWHCSECNRIVCGAITTVNPVYSYKYCPECGAKMQEVEDAGSD